MKGKQSSNEADVERDIEKSMKDENDLLIGQLYTTIKSIKRNTQDINDKIHSSNVGLDDMNKKYSDSNSLLTSVTKQLGEVFSANSNYWCYLIIFIFVVFFFLYKITH